MAGFAIAMAAMSVAGAYQQREDEIDNAEEQERLNKLIVGDTLDYYKRASEQETFVLEQSADLAIAVQSQSMQQQAELELAANATGITGLSIEGLVLDIEKNLGQNLGDILENRDQELDNIYQGKIDTKRAGERQIRVLKKPTLLSSTLDMFAAGAQGYSTGSKLDSALSKPGSNSRPNLRYNIYRSPFRKGGPD